MNNRHFFAASIRTWKVDTDIEKLIRFMKKEKYPFSLYLVPVGMDMDYDIGLYLVPVGMDMDYDIESFKPQVEGTVFLTTIHPKTK